MTDARSQILASQPSVRLGTALLHEPLSDLASENLHSFRAVANSHALSNSLGVLRDLPGRWFGSGFNLIARPDFAGGNDIFLELNLTRESLEFSTIGSPIPNRGSQQDDINLFGLTYLQQISDGTLGGALHIEPGIWLNVPSTTQSPVSQSVARLACIPHGDAVYAQGSGSSLNGPPVINAANTVPFKIGAPTPGPGTTNPFPEYNLADVNVFRTKPVPSEITQAVVNDPNTLLRDALIGLTVTNTTVLEVSTNPTGDVENIPFIIQNANAAFVSATFWIEIIEGLSNEPFLQLQYTQTVLLNFLGLSWAHVSVGTLVKVF